jgi:glycosyltransferase involved in cell wall biosynthesis
MKHEFKQNVLNLEMEMNSTGKQNLIVSVVIPSYNRRSFLGSCLESLTKQTCQGFEVIIVDDGSTDDTIEFLVEFKKGHPGLNLRWFIHKENLGANIARNRGVQEAKGAFVAFLDSDCIVRPEWLEELIKGFDNNNIASVTGLVISVKPKNIYQVAYKGTSRIHGSGDAPRIVSNNMCVRRDLLLNYPFDEDLKYGCNEEGLFLRLRAAGYRQRFIPTAIVLHDHPHTRKTFFRRAWILGKAAAWLVYKYHLPHRIDLLPFFFGYLSLPLGLLNGWLFIAPLFFFTAAIAALIYNDLFRKRKTLSETLISFPVLLAYYHVRLFAYVKESLRLMCSQNHIKRIDLSQKKQ